MRVIIDRFEGEYAVCEKEDRQMINIPLSSIPFDIKKGYVLIMEGNSVMLDLKETERRKNKIDKMVDELWK